MSKRFEQWFGTKDRQKRDKYGNVLPEVRVIEEKLGEESLLSKHETQAVKRGFETLTRYLGELSQKDFPKAVVLTDISARPLVYGVKPLFSEIAKQKGFDAPTYHFMLGFQGRKSDLMLVRAKEIIEHSHVHSGDRMMVIDEFYLLGRTLDSAAELLHQAHPDLKIQITKFGLMAGRNTIATLDEMSKEGFYRKENGIYHQTDERKKEQEFGPDDGLILGTDGPMFNYYHTERQKIVVGVTKRTREGEGWEDQKYVTRSESRSPELMRKLRGEFSAIGEQVASEVRSRSQERGYKKAS